MARFSLDARGEGRRRVPVQEKKVPPQDDEDRELRQGQGAGVDLDVAAGPKELIPHQEADEGPVRIVDEGPAAAPEAHHFPTTTPNNRQRELSLDGALP